LKRFYFGAELAALLAVIIWGTNFVFQKAVLAEFDVMAFTFLRFCGMIAVAWLVLLLKPLLIKSTPPTATSGSLKKDLPRLFFAGILGYTLYIPLQIIGINFTTAFSGALLIGIAPLFTILLLHFLKVEKITLNQWLAVGVAIIGLLVFLGDKFSIGIQLGTFGDLISLISAFFYAAYLVANKPLTLKYSAANLTAYTLTLGAIPTLLISLPALFNQNWAKITGVGWLTLAWSIVVPVYLAWSLWSWVNARIGVARSSIFMYLVPLIGGVTSWLLLGENFGWLKILGAGLVLSGIILARKTNQTKKVEVELKPPQEVVVKA
jgi:drug/metabolite transporter (DMT)-like permease